MKEQKIQMIILSVLLYTSYIVVMNKWGHDDMMYWQAWSKQMFEQGLTSVYQADCDYLPGFLYILWLNTKIQHTATNVQDNLYVFKFFVLVFDFVGAYLAVYFIKDWNRKLYAYLFIVANIAMVYNTLAWAQVDAIFSCIGFAAVVLALNRKILWSCVLLVIALNFKLQALVFIPIVGLILLPQYLDRFSVGLTLKIVAVIVIAQLIMVFPFLIRGNVSEVWKVAAQSVDHYPRVSMAAFNFWFLAIRGDIPFHVTLSDTGLFLGMTYKNWGFLLFFSVLLLICLPMFKWYYLKYLKKIKFQFPLEKVFLMAALVAAAFFYFNTQMHERYFHPALLSLAAYTFLTNNYFPFILGSVAYFINMEKILRMLHLTNYNTFIFDPVFVAVLYLILFVYLFFRLYSTKHFNEQTLQLTADA